MGEDWRSDGGRDGTTAREDDSGHNDSRTDTQQTYVLAVLGLARHYNRSPDQLTDDQVQDYLLHPVRDKKRADSICDRLIHAAYTIKLTGRSLRKAAAATKLRNADKTT